MTYLPIPTVATGDMWTAANHNTYLKDNLAALNQLATENDLIQIAGQVLSVATAQIVISDIPSTRNHLKLLLFGRTNADIILNPIKLRFNGDSGNNYDITTIAAVGSPVNLSVSALIDQNNFKIGEFAGSQEIWDLAGAAEVNIMGYSQTSYLKYVRSFGSHYRYKPQSLESFGVWKNEASLNRINQILIFPDSGSFLPGTTFSLYGYS